MASSLESNRSRTCCRMSDELVHPMSGSTALGEACSKSSTHDLVLAVPDCIAVLAGLYMRAVVMNGGALWLCALGIQEPAWRSRPCNASPLGGQGNRMWHGALSVPSPLWGPCGEGWGSRSGPRLRHAARPPTPTLPQPKPRIRGFRPTQESDRNRQQPISIGGREKEPPCHMR